MTDTMEKFIVRQNIAHYRALLQTETHPDKRNILLSLLAEEIGKLPKPVKRAEIVRAFSFQ